MKNMIKVMKQERDWAIQQKQQAFVDLEFLKQLLSKFEATKTNAINDLNVSKKDLEI